MHRSLGIVRCRKAEQMLAQRPSNRDEKLLACLARGEANLIPFEIDLRPGERGEIAETLTSVEAELDEALPFDIGNREDGSQLIYRERTPFEGGTVLDRFDPFTGS